VKFNGYSNFYFTFLGIPSLEDNNRKGVLYITFDVEFPKGELTEEQKQIVADLLKQPDFQAKAYNGLQEY
jgi:DnaJ family protein B protein 11